ncbi:MAG: GNAT family N-acetyltransferase [Burkholderiales bacterium]|nr:GNAT family N-acetyltransferase [Burkholderiales bacterium]
MNWRFAHFDDLATREWHDIVVARESVFVLEQTCAFLDADGADPQCHHLIGKVGDEIAASIAAYARIVPPGLKYEEPSIGRVLTTRRFRRGGYGQALMKEAVARCEALYPGANIRIGAQMYLEKFYGGYGFKTVSEPYDEDGIQHVIMLRTA